MDLHPGTSRRSFLKAAVAVGGASALAACLDRFEDDEPIPTGTDDTSSLPAGQHEWNQSLDRDEHDNVILPTHHVFLYLDLANGGEPTASDRESVETALQTIEQAYEWSHRGAVFELAYSPSYFDRFSESLDETIDLPMPTAIGSLENPTLDTQDALLHIASDRPDALLAIEEAMFGDESEMNGVEITERLNSVFSVDNRRSGFIGPGLPAERQDISGIPDDRPVPEESPLFMGFKAGFTGNQATEESVTIAAGPFAGGTTKHVSTVRQELDKWYTENSFDDMVALMFSPELASRGTVEGVGNNLGDHSGVTEEIYENVREHAEQYRRVGHAEKAARANRDDDGNPLLLRRHVESTDGSVASLHFPTYQLQISDFIAVREAMNGSDLTDTPSIQNRVNNGILRYLFTQHRGNFLLPPRSLRSLPTPTGE